MSSFLKARLWWLALLAAVGESAVSGLSQPPQQRLDVSAPTTSLAGDALQRLAEISRSVCLQNPNLVGCHFADGSLGGGVSENTVSRLQSADGVSDLASLFILHISYIQEQYMNMVSERDELKEKVRALEVLNLQLMEPNLTDTKLSEISEALGRASIGQRNVYSPTAILLRPTDCADHLLLGHTSSGVYEIFPFKLRVEFDLADGTHKFSEWDTFLVWDLANKYKLSIGGFLPHSMTTDCLSSQNNNMFFSSFDYDNDRNNGNCASTYKTGWWYKLLRLVHARVRPGQRDHPDPLPLPRQWEEGEHRGHKSAAENQAQSVREERAFGPLQHAHLQGI
ncbi:putative ficolin-1 [Penaeus vannamei]|uniref:Putative ficolin-1 n=1 Tax=Penaeus vannamei TaxID=6689 RepID=A0A423TFU3_PENVA|nr:putative ficolin-1 [Penaeus vannamei]